MVDLATLRIVDANRDAFGYPRTELATLALPHLLPKLSRAEIAERVARSLLVGHDRFRGGPRD